MAEERKEELKEREIAKRMLLLENEGNLGLEPLIQKWCDKIANAPDAQLQQLALWKNIHLPLKDCVKLSQRLSRIKTKYDFRISEIVFKMHYKTEYGCSGVIIGSAEIIGQWSPSKS